MIEHLQARSGTPVFRVDGRQLCSVVDPIREAQNWVDKHARALAGNSKIVILGLGCGHHIELLRARLPSRKILVVNTDPQVAAACERIHPLLNSTIDILTVESLAQTQLHAKIRQLLRGPYVILAHPASQVGFESIYREIHAFLLGREPGLFASLIACDSRLTRLFPHRALAVSEAVPLLTIKSLDQMVERRTDGDAKDILLIKTLREMVK